MAENYCCIVARGNFLKKFKNGIFAFIIGSGKKLYTSRSFPGRESQERVRRKYKPMDLQSQFVAYSEGANVPKQKCQHKRTNRRTKWRKGEAGDKMKKGGVFASRFLRCDSALCKFLINASGMTVERVISLNQKGKGSIAAVAGELDIPERTLRR